MVKIRLPLSRIGLTLLPSPIVNSKVYDDFMTHSKIKWHIYGIIIGTTLADVSTWWCPSDNPVLICIIGTHCKTTGSTLETHWLPTIRSPVAFQYILGSKNQEVNVVNSVCYTTLIRSLVLTRAPLKLDVRKWMLWKTKPNVNFCFNNVMRVTTIATRVSTLCDMNKRIEIYGYIKDTHIKCFDIFHYNSGHTNPSKISQEDLNMMVTLPYLVNHIIKSWHKYGSL